MHLKLNVFGLWWGMLAGLSFILLLQLFFVLRTNWEQEVQNAVDRVTDYAEERMRLINDSEL